MKANVAEVALLIALDGQDRIVTALCVGVMLGAGALLYLEAGAPGSGGQVVGTLTRESGRVQRRASDRALWQTTMATVPLVEREWIRTGHAARALIRMHNGGSIELESLSMITLFIRRDLPELDLHEGSLRIQRSPGLQIRTKGGGTLRISGEGQALRSGDRLSLTAGPEGLLVRGPQGERALPPGEQFQAELEAPAQLPPPPAPRLVFPTEGGVVDMTTLSSLAFRWEAVPGAHSYRFVLRRGGRILASQQTQAATFVLRDLAVLDIGAFEWEVNAVRMDGGRATNGPTARAQFRITLSEGPGRPELDPPGGKKP